MAACGKTAFRNAPDLWLRRAGASLKRESLSSGFGVAINKGLLTASEWRTAGRYPAQSFASDAGQIATTDWQQIHANSFGIMK